MFEKILNLSIGSWRNVFTFFFTLIVTIWVNKRIIKKETQKDKILDDRVVVKEIIEDLNQLEFENASGNLNKADITERFLMLIDKCLIIFNHKKAKREKLDSISGDLNNLLYGEKELKDEAINSIIDKIRDMLFNYIKIENKKLENINNLRENQFKNN